MDYPGARPAFSFVYYQQEIYEILRRGENLENSLVTLASRHVTLDEFLSQCKSPAVAQRAAVLAVGSNGCPGRLAEKFGNSPGATVPVLLGTIADVAVVYSRRFVSYGALPATFVRQTNMFSRLSLTLLSQTQLARMDETEQVGKMYERVPVGSPFVLNKDVSIDGVTAYLDRNILSYEGRPIYLKAFAHDVGDVDGLVMDQREVLAFVCDQAGVLRGESIESRHRTLVNNESVRQKLLSFLDREMADLRVDDTGQVYK